MDVACHIGRLRTVTNSFDEHALYKTAGTPENILHCCLPNVQVAVIVGVVLLQLVDLQKNKVQDLLRPALTVEALDGVTLGVCDCEVLTTCTLIVNVALQGHDLATQAGGPAEVHDGATHFYRYVILRKLSEQELGVAQELARRPTLVLEIACDGLVEFTQLRSPWRRGYPRRRTRSGDRQRGRCA